MKSGRGSWIVALSLSLALHAGAAAILFARDDDTVQIAGGEPIAVTILGNAFEDSLSAGSETGDPAVAEPVETETAATAEPVQPEAAEPAREMAEAVPRQAPAPVTPVAPANTAPPVVAPVEPELLGAEPVQPAPEIAVVPVPTEAAETVQPGEDERDIVAAVAAPSETERPEVETAEPVVPDVAEIVEDVPEDPNDPYNVIARLDDAPVPTPRPDYEPPAPRRERADRPAERQPERQQQRPRREQAGSGGNSTADARRGSAEGSRTGSTAQSGGEGRQASAAGNAAVSNYPGQVVSRLRRSLRYPGEARRQRLRGEVHVAFSVNGNGGVSSVSVVRSSGHAVLDQAALETVRRASPFPAIPAGAGRSSWAFTVPLAFSR